MKNFKNEDRIEDEFLTGSPEEMCENYKIIFNVNIDYSSNN